MEMKVESLAYRFFVPPKHQGLSHDDICYPGATFRGLRASKLRRSHVVPSFELSAEVRGLFVAEIKRHFLYGIAADQQTLCRQQPTLVQPILRCPTELPAEMALQLPRGDFAKFR